MKARLLMLIAAIVLIATGPQAQAADPAKVKMALLRR